MQPLSPDAGPFHVAAFSNSGEFVGERVASFITEGLGWGEHVVVMCTTAHWNAVAERLDAGGVAYGRAMRDGRLVFVNAEELLDAITENGLVSGERFRDILQPLVKPATRVYGEVVSLLAERGDVDGAMALEQLGQQLVKTARVRILCGYHVAGPRPLSAAAMARIREVHDHCVVESEAPSLSSSTGDGRRVHAVRFYQDHESLARIVAGFLGQGFAAGSPALVVATPQHRQAISRALSAQFFDIGRLEASGELILADAAEVLSSLMVDGMPDPDRFKAAVIPLVEQAARRRAGAAVRAYGEMVDLLWKGGQTVAAVRLETYWNQLAQRHTFDLLCGYAMGNFYKSAAQETISRQHTHVVFDRRDAAIVH
jgi:hypothetical protein